MSHAAHLLGALAARAYYLSWLVATHPALNESDAAAMHRNIASLSNHCARIAAQIIGA